MKRILLFFSLLISVAANSQLMQTNNTPGGYQFMALKANNLMIVASGPDTVNIGPTMYGVSTVGAMFYKTTDSTFWLRSTKKWNQISGGGGSSTWGSITGSITNQTDLINYISNYVSANAYTLPIASASVLGGIKVGNNLSINPVTGVLSATGSSGGLSAVYAGYGLLNVNDSTLKFDSTILTGLLTGGDTSVFSVTLDSTGQPNHRVLWAGSNNKIQSSAYFLFDSALNKLIINYNNVSAGDPNTRLYVNGNIEGNAALKLGPTINYHNDTTNYKPLVISPSGGFVGRLSSWPVVNDPTKLNKADSVAGGYYPYSTNPKGYLTVADSQLIRLRNHLAGQYVGDTLDVYETATGVTAGSYTNANITVDSTGKIIEASNGTGGAGSVTNVSSADANATVANQTTTPVITIVSAPKLQTGRTIAITGDLAYTSPSFDGSGNVTAAGTLATVNSNVGTFGSASKTTTQTVTAKGLTTAISQQDIAIAESQVTNLTTDLAAKLNISDTANKWVNSITKNATHDSIIYYIGTTRYAVRDSIGNGSGGWILPGNTGTTTSHFIGTTDSRSLRFKTNGVLRQIIDSVGFVGINTAVPTAYLHATGGDMLPAFGSELINTANYTSTGWTTVVAGTYTHNTGNTTALTNTLAGVVGTGYRVLVTVTGRTAGTFTVTFAGVTSNTITPTTGTNYFEIPIVGTSTGTLSVTPISTFDGTVTLSIKTPSGNSTPIANFANSTTGLIEVRADTILNMFMGANAGARNISGAGTIGSLDGIYNTAFGPNALAVNISGANNNAYGYNALALNTSGFSNFAGGPYALAANTTGSNNVGIGGAGNNGSVFRGALRSNTTGSGNVGIGGEVLASGPGAALGTNTTGSFNTALGAGALRLNLSGGSNTGIGATALFANSTGGNNTAVGTGALAAATGSNNTATGWNAFQSLVGGSGTGYGAQVGWGFTSGFRNTVMGDASFGGTSTTNTGSDNAGLGYSVGAHNNSLGAIATSRNIFGGNYSGIGIVNGANDNAFYGYASGNGTTAATSISGKNNIAIGSAATLPSLTSDNQITLWVGATGGSGGYNAITRFTGGQWLLNNTTSAVTSAPNASAALEINGTTGAFILPRLTKTQRDALTAAAGMMIYQTDNTPGLRVFNGTNWMRYTETAD